MSTDTQTNDTIAELERARREVKARIVEHDKALDEYTKRHAAERRALNVRVHDLNQAIGAARAAGEAGGAGGGG